MGTSSQKLLTQDRTDLDFNSNLSAFYIGNDKIYYGNYVVLKKSFDSLLIDTTFDNPVRFNNIGQQYPKHNDLNILTEESYNKFIGYDIEKAMFDYKSGQTYSPDIYNKFENYLTDNTSNFIIKLDLSTILSSFDADPDFQAVIENSDGCHAKLYLNINSIIPYEKKNVSNSECVNLYKDGYVQSYFKNVNQVIKSCLSQNRLLYDHFFSHRRKSFIFQDFTGGTDYVSAYFYNMRYDNGNLNINLFKYDTMWGFRHHYIDEAANKNIVYTNTTATTFMHCQQGNTMDINDSDYQYGSYPILNPVNMKYKPIQIVYDTAPTSPHNTCMGGDIQSFSFDISTISNFDRLLIKSADIHDNKQYEKIDLTTFTSVYTLNVTTTDNKQFSIPFIVDSTYIDSSNQNILIKNIIAKDSCVLFDQNELNTVFDGVDHTIAQDVFDISTVLSLQSYDESLGVLTLNYSNINISNTPEVTLKIVSSLSKILKIDDYYVNDYILVDRNIHGIKDPQNWSRFNICKDLPEDLIENRMVMTTLGPSNQRYLNSCIWNSYLCGPNPDNGTRHLVSGWGNAITYQLNEAANPVQLYAFNFMKNILENNETVHQSTSYNPPPGYGLHGFYNSLLNKMYILERYPSYQLYLSTWDLGSDTKKTLLNSGVDGLFLQYNTGFSKFKIDTTSLELHNVTAQTGYGAYYVGIHKDTYSFNKGNFLNYKHVQYGPQWEYIHDDRVYHGFPSFVGDDTVLIGDHLGNKYEIIYQLQQLNATTYRSQYKKSIKLKKYGRLLIPPKNQMQMLFRFDATTAQGYQDRFTINDPYPSKNGVFQKVTPTGIELFPIIPYVPYFSSDYPTPATAHIIYDETTQYRSISDDDEETYARMWFTFRQRINDIDKTSDGTYIGGINDGKPAFPDQQNGLMYYMLEQDGEWYVYTPNRQIYTIDINTGVKTFITRTIYPQINLLYSQTRDIDSGDFYFLGTDIDNSTSVILIRCQYDSDTTTYTILDKWEISDFPTHGNPTSSNFYWFSNRNFIQKKDDAIIGVMGSYGDSFHIKLTTDDTLFCNQTGTICLQDEEDREYQKMMSIGSYSAIQFKDSPAIIKHGAIFLLDGYDEVNETIVHKKLYNAPWTQYIDVGNYLGYEENSSAPDAQWAFYTLSNERKHYIMGYGSPNFKLWCYTNLDEKYWPKQKPKFAHRIIPAGDQTVSDAKYCNGWNINNDFYFISYIASDTYYVGEKLVTKRRIEQRKFDTFLGYQKVFNTYASDIYTSTTDSYIRGSQRNLDNSSIIDICSYGGCVYSWNPISNEYGKRNVQIGKGFGSNYYMGSSVCKRFAVVPAASNNYQLDGYGSSQLFVFNKSRNRWYAYPYYTQQKANKAPQYPTVGFYCKGDHIVFPQMDSAVGKLYFFAGANCDSYLMTRQNNFFQPNPPFDASPSPNRYQYDDASNMVQSWLSDQYIISKPKFYNNIFSVDICPSTFDEYADSVHTMIDDKQWALGIGQQQFKNVYDSIYVYKMHLNTSTPSTDYTWIRTGKINNEVSFNYRTLRYQRHNIGNVAYTQNNGNNMIIGSMAANLLSDFTALDFTKVDESTLFVSGLIKFDQTINAGWESIDLGMGSTIGSSLATTRTDFWGDGQDDTIVQQAIYLPVTCDCLSIPITDTVNFEDIVSYSVDEFNDFYIGISVTDSTGNNTTINVNNPKSTFSEFNNNKHQWVVRTAFFKQDSTEGTPRTQISTFVTVPHIGKIVEARWDYSNDVVSSGYYYKNKYDSKYQFYNTDTSANLQYCVPISFVKDTSIMQLADDVSNRLISVQLGTGTIISEINDIKIRYKQPHGDIFKIQYDKQIGSDYLRYIGILGSDGTLIDLGKNDILSEFIINNKNYDTTEFVITPHENFISITNNSDITVENIPLGENKEFVSVNQKYDTSSLTWISVFVRNFNSHTTDEYVLIINKTDQKYDITGKRFSNNVYDGSNQVNLAGVVNEIFQKSNGIISIKNSANYPLYSKLISYYNNDDKCIKYFDFKDGFIYKLEDVIVYDGAFFYNGIPASYSLDRKEFAIQDKMYPNMQYLDDLPNVFFYPYKCCYDGTNTFGSPTGYIYDNSDVYLLVNFSPTISKIKIDMESLVLINYNDSLASYVTSDMTYDYITEILLDHTGYFPYGMISLERINKFNETLSKNRLVKLTLDYTFLDQSNTFSNSDFMYSDTVIDNTIYNPFTSMVLATESYESITDMRTYSNLMYADFTNTSSYITSRLMPEWNQRSPITTGSGNIVNHNGKIEAFIDPLASENVLSIFFTALTLTRGHQMNSYWNYPAYFKYYHSRVAVTASLTYNNKLYSIIDKGIKSRPVNIANDYTYSYMTMNLRAYDWKQIIWKNHPNRLYTYFNSFNEYSMLRRNYNQTWGVILSDATNNLNPLISSDLSNSIAYYSGSVDLSSQTTGIIIDSTRATASGNFIFSSDITFISIDVLLTDIFGTQISLDFSATLFDSSGDVVYDSVYTTNSSNQNYMTSTHSIQLSSGVSYVGRRLELFVKWVPNSEFRSAKIFGLNISNTPYNTQYAQKKMITTQDMESFSYGLGCSISPESSYKIKNSMILLTGGWNDTYDKTVTIIGRPDTLGFGSSDCTLYMNGYDGTYIEIDSGSNSQQKHDFTTRKESIGFKIKVKQESKGAVPIIKISSDSTSDDFGGNDDRLNTIYIKGSK